MERKELKKELKKVFISTLKKNGFKRINKKWIIETDDLIKEVELQKSNYRDLYYLNYIFTFKNTPQEKFKSHIYSRYGIKSKVLDLENDLVNEKRLVLFEKMINELVITKINPVNTIKDILEIIKENPYYKNMLSKIFKEHFCIKD